MKEFEYPFDADFLLKKKKSLSALYWLITKIE